MNENLDMFICTHVKPHRLSFPADKTYKVVGQKKELDIESNLDVIYAEPEKMEQWGLMPRGLSELYNMYYVRHFVEKKEYIGFCQYRAYPFFHNQIPDIDAMMKRYDVLFSRRMATSVGDKMEKTLDAESFKAFKDIINEDYPEYASVMKRFLAQHEYMNRAIFIMKTEDFNKMIDFAFGMMQKYLRKIDCHTDEELYARTLDMIEKKTYPTGLSKKELRPLTLSRMLARFGEFAISFYIWKNFRRKKSIFVSLRGTKRLDGGEPA